MDCRMLEMEPFTVVGKSAELSCRDNAHSRLIPEFWATCHRDGTIARLGAISSDQNLFGIVLDSKPDSITYMIACKSDRLSQAEGLAVQVIPAATWAVFTAVGPVPQALQSIFQRVFQEGLPVTGYAIAPGPQMEVYPPGDLSAADYRCEAWIPIKHL